MDEKKKKDGLDTETSFADMNVEGMPWYDPGAKKRKNKDKVKLTRKEYWSMVLGAFQAMLPMMISIACALILVFLLMYLWLNPN